MIRELSELLEIEVEAFSLHTGFPVLGRTARDPATLRFKIQAIACILETKDFLNVDMPGKVDGPQRAVKRKREESNYNPSKRSRSESSEEDAQARILLLETQIFESKKNYNNISTLIKLSQNGDKESTICLVASIALCRVFSRLMASGDFTKKPSTTEKESVVALWLHERYSEYKAILLQLLNSEASGSTALTLCMRMLKSEGAHLHNGQDYCFPTLFLRSILRTIFNPNCGDAVRREFCERYLKEYDDVRFHTFMAVE